MTFDGLSNEAIAIFDSITNSDEYQYYTIDLFFIELSNERNRTSSAYKILSDTMLTEDLDIVIFNFSQRYQEAQVTKRKSDIDSVFSSIIKSLRVKNCLPITSGDIMIEIISTNKEVKDIFSRCGVLVSQLENALVSERIENFTDTCEKHKKNRSILKKQKNAKEIIGEAERNLINLSEIAENGNLDHAYGNDSTINEILAILSKKKFNNVVLVGEHGVGKTVTVKHIANLISSGLCPSVFNNKIMLEVDFAKLLMGTMYKGLFEAKFQSIIDDASNRAKYIFFVDNIHNILNNTTKISEMPTSYILDKILSNENILFICTTTESGYSKYILPNKLVSKMLTKVDLKEKSDIETMNVIKNVITDYENFHNVAYTDKSILTAISLSKKYIKNKALPESAIDLLDEAGALASISIGPNPDIEEVKSKLISIKSEINEIENSTIRADYDKIDELKRTELSLASELSRLERIEYNSMSPIEVNEDNVIKIVNNKVCGVKNAKFSDERDVLIGLENRLKSKIIGQDEAIDVVTRAVKRKLVGVSNQEKPVVMMMVGKTGTGKTLLAKTLAEEIFGSQEYLVRIDMSEYSDKMSVNKFTGSAAGYVGYEEGGILTEAIKKKSKCVLLLDEIEKANGDVFNLLLQVFDEGRLTDNKGFLVDFKDVIIIMTSNVGAKEVSEASGRIGFSNKDIANEDEKLKAKTIIRNAMKSKFTPEFLNRIDKIVWFNDLTDDDLKDIIVKEIINVSKRIERLDYTFSKELFGGKLVDSIFESIVKQREYGARPILREIEEKLEDRIADMIISGNIYEGHVFNENEICN